MRQFKKDSQRSRSFKKAIFRMKLLLFDIDGTLLKPVGVGKRAFLKALQQKFGDLSKLSEFSFDGLLGRQIVEKSLKMMGVTSSQEEKSEILKCYVENLKKEIPDDATEWLCPNVPQILKESLKKGFHLAILTGNIKNAAFLKLKSLKLDNYLKVGSFGDDADERWQLVDIAIERAEKYYSTKFAKDGVFLVGDSTRDVEAGRKAGIKVISVATGLAPYEKLQILEPFLLLRDMTSSNFLDALK